MKKSRSSTPRLDARWPGLLGTAGVLREEGVDADPRVAIAVGKTLFCYFAALIMESAIANGGHTMKDPSFLRNWKMVLLLQGRSKVN